MLGCFSSVKVPVISREREDGDLKYLDHRCKSNVTTDVLNDSVYIIDDR